MENAIKNREQTNTGLQRVFAQPRAMPKTIASRGITSVQYRGPKQSPAHQHEKVEIKSACAPRVRSSQGRSDARRSWNTANGKYANATIAQGVNTNRPWLGLSNVPWSPASHGVPNVAASK